MTTSTQPATLAGRRTDLIVYFGCGHWNGPPGTDRHVAEELSAFAPVLYIDPPVSMLTRLRRDSAIARQTRVKSLRVLSPRIAHLVTHVVPAMTRPGVDQVALRMARSSARSAVARLFPGQAGTPVAAVVSSRVENVWPAVPTRRTLFYSIDDPLAGAELFGLPVERLVRAERHALRTADVVAAVSPSLAERYASLGHPAEIVPNGCDVEAYADVDNTVVPADAVLPGPVAGFVGHINERIDLSLLTGLADRGCSLLLVGPVAPGYRDDRFAALIARPSVRWVGPKPFAELPGYLRAIDVGLTPYADTDFNRASFPLKTLEYLAAGRAVVATPLPANTWLNTNLITEAAGPDHYADAVMAALAKPRTADLSARRRAFAEQHTWRRRATRLAQLLQLR